MEWQLGSSKQNSGGGERKKTRLDDKKARRQSAIERILLCSVKSLSPNANSHILSVGLQARSFPVRFFPCWQNWDNNCHFMVQ